MTTLDAIEKAVGEVAANGHEDVRQVLSPAAIERVARAVLMTIREPDEATIESLFQARDGFVDRQDIAPLHRLIIDFALGESNETDDLTKSAVITA